MVFWRDRFSGSERERYMHRLMESLLSMAWFVEARDPYTGGHLWRVSRYARLLADAAGLDEAVAAKISLGGFLHDLGKVSVPDAILRKPGPLTDDEYSQIKTHPNVGLRMLAGHPLAQLVADAVGLHHERPDGRGYPHGLSGDQWPIDARIVGICDAFDAMTSHRPYRSGMPMDRALTILEEEAGRQFDSELVREFIRLGRQGELTPILGHSDDGIPLQTCPMCGPTLVVRREQVAGEQIYCRSCSGEFQLKNGSDRPLMALPTGRQGSAADLEPEADEELIGRTVRGIVSDLPVEQLMRTTATGRR